MSFAERALPPSYRIIGAELLALEGRYDAIGRITPSSFKSFRQGVVTISVEVLESYLEDLLDNSVDDGYLFIERAGKEWVAKGVALVGLGAALAAGLYLAVQSDSIALSFPSTLLLACPFAWLWHRGARLGANRRMFFAHIVSHEIARRRGISRDEQGRPLTPAGTIQSILTKDPAASEGTAMIELQQ